NPYCDGTGVMTASASGNVYWLSSAGITGPSISLNLPVGTVDGDKIYAFNTSGAGCFSLPDSVIVSIPVNDLSLIMPPIVCPETQLALEATGNGAITWIQDGTLEDTTGHIVTA